MHMHTFAPCALRLCMRQAHVCAHRHACCAQFGSRVRCITFRVLHEPEPLELHPISAWRLLRAQDCDFGGPGRQDASQLLRSGVGAGGFRERRSPHGRRRRHKRTRVCTSTCTRRSRSPGALTSGRQTGPEFTRMRLVTCERRADTHTRVHTHTHMPMNQTRTCACTRTRTCTSAHACACVHARAGAARPARLRHVCRQKKSIHA